MHDWKQFDTVLLDMDGTVLDLAFDNYFWRELVPRCLARSRSAPQVEVTSWLFERYASKQGTLDWYCLDFWAAELALDLRALKNASSHRVRYLPGSADFLTALRASGKRYALVTNAHGYTLDVKKGVAGLGRHFDTFVSSHDLGFPKEDPRFWPALADLLHVDPATTLFIDDSEAVLEAAAGFGIRGILAVTRPDSRLPPRDCSRFAAVEAIGDLPRAGRPGRSAA
jgi:putative hydrolase of the HAD superfamily